MASDAVDHTGAPMPMGAPFWSNPAARAVSLQPTWSVAAVSETLTVVRTGVDAPGPVGAFGPAPVPPPLHAAKNVLSRATLRAGRASDIVEIACFMERPEKLGRSPFKPKLHHHGLRASP
jgi:hypothetical protein